MGRIVRAGLFTALVDGLFSSVLSVAFYGSTVARLFQGVAAVPLGSRALEGGTRTEVIGIAIHVGVAFAWSIVFALVARSGWLDRLLRSRSGVLAVAALYGPFVWCAMSLGIVPLFTHRSPAIAFRWWVQFFGHMPFVGLPIVATMASGGKMRSR
jgi:hypothetical protein